MPIEQKEVKVKQKKHKVKQRRHRVKVKDAEEESVKTSQFADLVKRITAASIILLMLMGCSNYKVTLPDGTEHLFQRVGLEGSAKEVDFYYEDQGCVVWLVVKDPNSTVNPVKMTIKEPNTGIEGSIEAQ